MSDEPDESERLPLCICPVCGRENDAATAIGDDPRARPKAGDQCVCLYCGNILTFQGIAPALTLRAMTPDEFSRLPLELQMMLARASRAARIVQHRRAQRN
jgi:hypothetical protein